MKIGTGMLALNLNVLCDNLVKEGRILPEEAAEITHMAVMNKKMLAVLTEVMDGMEASGGWNGDEMVWQNVVKVVNEMQPAQRTM